MKDPIKIYENLKEQYFKYIDTAFSVDDESFTAKRKELYLSNEHKHLYKFCKADELWWKGS